VQNYQKFYAHLTPEATRPGVFSSSLAASPSDPRSIPGGGADSFRPTAPQRPIRASIPGQSSARCTFHLLAAEISGVAEATGRIFSHGFKRKTRRKIESAFLWALVLATFCLWSFIVFRVSTDMAETTAVYVAVHDGIRR